MVELDLGLKAGSRPMKNQRTHLSALIAVVVLAVLGSSALAADVKVVTLDVEGMTCGGCSASVRVVLTKLDGVRDAKVSFDEKRAVVTYDPATVTPQKMADTINAKLPYKAKVASAEGSAKP